MENENIAPVHHSGLSAAGATTAGAAGGALSAAAKVALFTIGAGALVGVVVATGGFGLGLGGALGAKIIGGALIGGVGSALLVAPFTGTLGGLFGGIKGGHEAAQRVRQEKGAATMLDAQLAAYQAQLASPSAQTNIYTGAADSKILAGQNPAMNAAASSMDAATIDYQGKLAQQQLERA